MKKRLVVFLFLLSFSVGCMSQEGQQTEVKESEKNKAENESKLHKEKQKSVKGVNPTGEDNKKKIPFQTFKEEDQPNFMSVKMPQSEHWLEVGPPARKRLYKLLTNATQIERNPIDKNQVWEVEIGENIPPIFFNPTTLQFMLQNDERVYEIEEDARYLLDKLVVSKDRLVLFHTYFERESDLNKDGKKELVRLTYDGNVNLHIDAQKVIYKKDVTRYGPHRLFKRKFHIIKDGFIVIGEKSFTNGIGSTAQWKSYQYINGTVKEAFSPVQQTVKLSYVNSRKLEASFNPYPNSQILRVRTDVFERYPRYNKDTGIKGLLAEKDTIKNSHLLNYNILDYDNDGEKELLEYHHMYYPENPWGYDRYYVLYELVDGKLEGKWMYFIDGFEDILKKGYLPVDKMQDRHDYYIDKGVLNKINNKVYINTQTR